MTDPEIGRKEIAFPSVLVKYIDLIQPPGRVRAKVVVVQRCLRERSKDRQAKAKCVDSPTGKQVIVVALDELNWTA